jgi:hypothetical protein
MRAAAYVVEGKVDAVMMIVNWRVRGHATGADAAGGTANRKRYSF